MNHQGPLTLDGPSGCERLFPISMHGTEELGRVFNYELELLSEASDFNPSTLLGQGLTVHLELAEGSLRHFNGYVTSITLLGRIDERAAYRVSLRPWLWFLGKTANCRIFQGLSVPGIIKQVFRQHGFSGFQEVLHESYRQREFVVQYRETDLDFVSRLMEEEGIYFFFKHSHAEHTLVLCDSYASHEAAPEAVPYFPPGDSRGRHVEHIDEWSSSRLIQPCAYALTDFDFERPSAGLFRKREVARGYAPTNLEVFDFPGGYEQGADGETYARIRLEELQVEEQRSQASANARGLGCGRLLKPLEHPDEAENAEYLIVRAEYALSNYHVRSAAGEPEEIFRVRFEAIPSSQPFRSPRRTPKPRIHGAQTAIVVGKAGQEIWTDAHGRVKLKFHWDRSPDRESSSCWVRVAQLWAGGGWGAMHVPRIGQEVVVEFLEGDPDRPLVVGRVYNGNNAPPYALPDNQTQSGVKSRSTKDGTANNFNELRFEDKLGEEQVFMQAERDYELLVKRDASQSIGEDETHLVCRDRRKTIQRDELVLVARNRTETVIAEETIAVGANRTECVGANEVIDIGQLRNVTIGASDTLVVGDAQIIQVDGRREETVQQDESVTINGKRSHTVGKDDSLEVGKKLVIHAGDEVTIKTGQAAIVMKKNGDIVIEGRNITLSASGKVSVKASGAVSVKGSKVTQN